MNKKDQYKKIYDNLIEGIVQIDEERKILRANPSFVKMMGYETEQELLDTVLDIKKEVFHDAEDFDLLYEILIENKKVNGFETQFVKKSGKIFWVVLNIYIVEDDSGFVLEGSVFDISYRKKVDFEMNRYRKLLERMVENRTNEYFKVNKRLKNEIESRRIKESQLEENKMVLEFALQAAGNSIWDYNYEKDIVSFDNRIFETLGFDTNQIENSYHFFLTRIHPDDSKILKTNLIDSVNGQKDLYIFNVRLKNIDNEWMYFRICGKVFQRNIDGYAQRMIGTISNITDRIKAEMELKNARDKAEAANIAKNQFLANMSHELRTPMNGIVGMNSLLLETELTTDQKHFAESIEDSSDILMSIIEDILDYSKFDSGKVTLRPMEFELDQLFNEINNIYSIKAKNKGLEYISVIENDVPLSLIGAASKLKRILSNIIDNAVKFTDVGEISIRTELIESIDEYAKIKISISDTGVGISREKVENIFESFTQVDSTITRRYSGMGLGLSLAKKMADLMQAELDIKSELGWGTEFSLVFSFKKQKKLTKEKPRKISDEIRSKRILIINRNDDTLKSLKEIFDGVKVKYSIETECTDVYQTVKTAAINGNPFDAVLIEVESWNDKISRCCTEIKTDSVTKDTILFCIKKELSPGETKKLTDLMFNSFIPIPIKSNQLLGAISDAFSKRKTSTKLRSYDVSDSSLKQMGSVLIVEDVKMNQKVAAQVIKNLNLHYTIAENGEQAIELLKKKVYDIILMDIQMPVMDGITATEIIRDRYSDVIEHSTPIIALTAHALKGDRENILAMGFDDYISKPFKIDQFKKVVTKWIKLHEESTEIDSSELNEESFISRNDIFNKKDLLERAGNNEEFMLELISLFVDSEASTLKALEDALDDNDLNGIKESAHALKGIAGNGGAIKVYDTALKLEQAAFNNNLAACDKYVTEIKNDFIELNRYLKENQLI